MKKKYQFLIFITILLVAIFGYLEKVSTRHSDILVDAIENYIDTGEHSNVFLPKHYERLEKFREKFLKAEFDNYALEAFQPSDEKIIYLMLLVEPTEVENSGIVLYITCPLESTTPLRIKDIIISNWVIIDQKGQQF